MPDNIKAKIMEKQKGEKSMNLKKMKRFFAVIMACACVCSGFGNISVQASQNQESQQADESSLNLDTAQTDDSTEITEEMEETEAVMVESAAEENAKTDDTTEEGKVTFGVVSDTHVTASKTTEKERLAKAFQRFSGLGLDRMVVVGDLTDSGSTSEYDTWKEIKDANLTIPLIASMGNHEGNSAAGFEETTGNIPNNNQVVNGYHFITLSPGSGTLDETTGRGSAQGGGNYTYTLDWLKKQLDAAVAEDPEKPIFVFFHHPIKNTFYVSHEWYGYGLEEIFKDYPQVVTFSGHIHSPNNNPTSIWQDGGYTAINTVTLSYMELETGMIYGSIPPNANNIAQGLEVTVDGSVVTIKNYDFISDQYLDQTWTFDITKELPYTEERKAGAVAPEFDADDKITLSEIADDSVNIEFDQASVPENSVGDIVHSYRYDFIEKATGKVAKTFKTFSEYYFTPMPEKITQTATDLNAGTEYELKIYAIDAYGLVSENCLTETFKTTGENNSVLTFEDMTSGIPTADLLDVDFAEGVIADHSAENHTFYGSDGSNITMNETLGKYTAKFTGESTKAFCTNWTSDQYAKTNDGFTMESVVYVDAFTEDYVNFFGNMQSAGIGFEIYPNSDDSTKADVTAFVHIDGGYKIPRATAAIEFNTWNHMVVTYNGSRVILYINGEKVASVAASGEVKTPAEGAQYYVIGGDSGSSYGVIQSPISGEVSTARMYSEALSGKQIKMLANRELKSLDTEKPLIQKESDAQNIAKQNKTYTVPAAKAADNSTVVTLKAEIIDSNNQVVYTVGGDSAFITAGTFIAKTAGSYKLVYTAVDAAGNSTTDETVIVVEASAESEITNKPTPTVIPTLTVVPTPTVSLTDIEKTITSTKGNKDVAGSSFAALQAKAEKQTTTSVKLKWNKIKGADEYQIYGSKCGSKKSYKLITTIKDGNKTSYTQKKLEKGTAYKYIVCAYKNVGNTKVNLAVSKTVYTITKGGKYGVAKKVKVNDSSISLKVKGTFKLKATEVKADKKIKQYRKVCFESSNKKIATVSKSGKITAKKKGTCYIYAYAQNGVCKKVKVTVKK